MSRRLRLCGKPSRQIGRRIGLVFAGLLLALPAERAVAQTSSIIGRVVDAETDAPVAGVEVRLLGDENAPVAGVLTDAAGAFTMVAELGRYRLNATRIGYAEATTSPIDLLANDTVRVEVRISARAVELAPLEVLSERAALVMDARLIDQGFYERRALYGREGMGFAYFLDYEDLRKRATTHVTDYLRDVPGVRVYYGGRRRITTNMSFCIDGMPFPLRGAGINEIVAATDVVAIEVYSRGVGDARFLGTCSVVLWTGYHEGMPARVRPDG